MLVQHLFEAHSSEEEFCFTCIIVPCGHVFTSGSSYSGYLTHCHRKHPNWKQRIEAESSDDLIDADHDTFRAGNCTLSDGRESTVLPVLSIDERIVEEQNEEKENVEAVAARFLLTLKEKHKLTQVTLDFILSSVSRLITIISKKVKSSVLERVKDSNIISLLDDCFLPVDPFHNLKTEYQQMRFYKEYFNLIVSCS